MTESITVVADSIRNWTEPGEVRVLLLHGNVYVSQGLKRVRAPSAVAWIYEGSLDEMKRIEIYAEGGVRLDGTKQQREQAEFYETWQTRSQLRIEMKERHVGPAVDDPVYRRGEARRRGIPTAAVIQQASFQVEPPTIAPDGSPLRRLKLSGRTSRPFELDTVRTEDGTAWVGTGGINVVIYNVARIGTVDISADRVVIWTRAADAQQLAQGETAQEQTEPLEMYLEGNVVLRQGLRIIEATQMYYDVNRNVAVANDAKLEEYNETIGTPVYFRARKLRQLSEDKFVAENTQMTPSRFANPGYDVQTEQAILEGIPGSGTDPNTGEPTGTARHRVTAINNVFHVEGIPVFFLPRVEKELEDMSTPLRKVALRHSDVYGGEIHSTWDMFQLFGLEQPPNVSKWELDLDYMTERGPGIGTLLEYRGDELFGVEGKNWGLLDTWWLYDHGLDRLGEGRRDIEPEQMERGRFLFRHRHLVPNDFSLSLEFAWITDINFLEQFFEKEWEEEKDQETAIYLKQQRDNWAWSILARKRLMDFITSTDYLPQFDFYLLGEPLLGDWLTYFQHSSAGYLSLLDSDRSNGDIYPTALGTEGPTFVGSRFDSLHEVDLPFSAGPVRIVPYVMGRATYWSRVIEHEDEGRLYGAVGTRASMPLWRVFPTVESDLWNVHGLAHKIVFSLDYTMAQSDLAHTLLPQYDELEDDSEQVFRERFLFRDYGVAPGGMGPPGLDPRLYAIRRGLMTAPESVDDLHVLRLDARQRLQTKRGLPGRRHVIDWMTLDTSVAFFPSEDRDNFGESFGLWSYYYSWHIGDRTSILSSGWFETYEDAPLEWNAGVFMERPPRGSVYLGFSRLDPVDSRAIHASYNYWMSPKWISSFSTSYDFGETANLGQSLVLTRIGADIVFRLGFSWNPLRDNFGIGLELQPRVAPNVHLGSLGGPRVPVEFAPVE